MAIGVKVFTMSYGADLTPALAVVLTNILAAIDRREGRMIIVVDEAHRVTSDPDAGEVLQNTVHGSIACFGNTPAVQFGDSGASPNVVGRHAIGQCGFNVISPDPNYGSGGPQPISVKAP